MASELNLTSSGERRGPAEHSVRDEIIAAANAHFRLYGYGKTTVSDLAKAIGFSKAYIYKFFKSKQEIGEAICGTCLSTIVFSAEKVLQTEDASSDKLRRLFSEIVRTSVEIFINDRKLYDVTAHAAIEKWSCTQSHAEKIQEFIRRIIVEGQASGEFEAETSLDKIVTGIFHAMKPFIIPPMLVHNLDDIQGGLEDVTELVLRSLRKDRCVDSQDCFVTSDRLTN